MRCAQRQQRRVLIAAVTMLAAGFSGCKVTEVKRQDEIKRFDTYLKDQSKQLTPQTARALTMFECERIAIANSLDLQIQRMSLNIADDRTRIAMTRFLPNANASYTDTTRSNSALIQQGAVTVPAGDRNTQTAGVQATMPILDWGITYYGYQIAKDSQAQQNLLLTRSMQLLMRDVRIAYVQHGGAVRREALLTKALQAALEVQRIARSLEKAGETVRSDTALVDASVAQAQLDLSLQQKEVRDTKLALEQLMSLPPTVEFTVDVTKPTAPEVPTEKELLAMENRALEARPELAVQDLTLHISEYEVKRQFANFFPRVDGVGGFNWSSDSQLVNPSWWAGGIQVSSGLLDGGADIFRYSIAKQQKEIENARSLLLSLGVLYQVEMGALQVRENLEVAKAAATLEYARNQAMEQVISLYQAGIRDPAGAARALADLTIQSTALDRAQQVYLVSWLELEATVLPERPFVMPASATTRPTSQPSDGPEAVEAMLRGVMPGMADPTTRPAVAPTK